MKRASLLAIALMIAAAPAVFAQASYKKELPDALLKKAKVTEDAAAKTALARVPKGKIESVELEEEGGKLIYSYDIKTVGKKGIDEVHVSAITGKVVNFDHETAAQAAKEDAADAKAAKKDAPKKKTP
jgi:hypothetical protein